MLATAGEIKLLRETLGQAQAQLPNGDAEFDHPATRVHSF